MTGLWVRLGQSAASYSPSPLEMFRILFVGWNYVLSNFAQSNWSGA